MGKGAFKNTQAKTEVVNENELNKNNICGKAVIQKRKTAGKRQSKIQKVFQNISNKETNYTMETVFFQEESDDDTEKYTDNVIVEAIREFFFMKLPPK